MYISFGLSSGITDVSQMYNWWSGHMTKRCSSKPNTLRAGRDPRCWERRISSSETKVHEQTSVTTTSKDEHYFLAVTWNSIRNQLNTYRIAGNDKGQCKKQT